MAPPDKGGTPEPQTAVNSQIRDTLALLQSHVTDNPGDIAATGLALSCAQSLSLAVQDAVDHLRRMQMIAEAQAINGKGDTAQSGVEAAFGTLVQATELATKTLKEMQPAS